ELTEGYLRAHTRAIEFIEENREEAVNIFVDHITEITGSELSVEETLAASERLYPTHEVHEEVLQEIATISYESDYMSSDDIDLQINTEFIDNVTSGEDSDTGELSNIHSTFFVVCILFGLPAAVLHSFIFRKYTDVNTRHRSAEFFRKLTDQFVILVVLSRLNDCSCKFFRLF